MTTETKYLRFERFDLPSRKTPIVTVSSRSSDAILGAIRWLGAWRQFVFEPSAGTAFNVECMTDIQTVIGELMAERRQATGEVTE